MNPPRPSTTHLPVRTRGFTLLEILVVLFIIGITLTFAVISVSGRNVEDRMQAEAERLEALLDLASDQAILYGVELGMDLTPKGYRFLRLGQNGWAEIGATDNPLRPRELDEGLDLRLLQEDEDQRQRLVRADDDEDEAEQTGPTPEVLFLSSGELSPFELQLRAENSRISYLFNGKLTGEIEMQRENPDQFQ